MRLIWIALIVVLVPMFTVQAQQRASDYKIDSLKAMLFYDNQGTFSADVSQEDAGSFLVPSILWNSPMEGASREGASTSMLVTIEVSGEFAYATPRRIQFTAAYIPLEGRRSLRVSRSTPIWIRENGKYIAGFWLYAVGCNPVALSARITGQRSSKPLERVVRFGCGE
jgi:hypothetical protein